MSLLHQELADGIGVLTLANDSKRNALSEELLDDLVYALAELKGQSARAVVLTARPGSKVWSAGHDIAELARPGHDPLAYDDPLEKAIRAIRKFPSPVIAQIEGTVWGGACELVLTCDLRVGTPQTTFAVTPARIGVPYNLNGLLNLVGAVGLPTAKQLLFTAEPLPSARAAELGVLNYVVSAEELAAFTRDLAVRISRHSALSISVMKEQLRILSGSPALTPETFEQIQALRRLVFESADYREGIDAFLRKQRPAPRA